jgi:hypothetical protein
MSRIFKITAAGLSALALSAAPRLTPNPPSKPVLTVSPSFYEGPCPYTLVFHAVVARPASSAPVRCRFIRSDGIIGPLEEVRFGGSKTATLTYTWKLGRDTEGWVALKLLAPVTLESDKALFRIVCRTGGPSAADDEPAPGEKPPAKFFLDLNDASLLYGPSAGCRLLGPEGVALGGSEEWEVCRVKPFLCHVRRRDWDHAFWQVNTVRREVIEIREGIFCSLSACKRRSLDLAVETEAAGSAVEAGGFLIRIPRATLVCAPADGSIQILAGRSVLSRGEGWEMCGVNARLHHLRRQSWPDRFWKINTALQKPSTVRAGTFCGPGGMEETLRADVRVVD